ncbi:beta family protein [Desulfofundulus thermocisternus]|uniref:beta family protein n=1 Tax=Desulfofundulus thermocisternus TaxID=42471 RepID=UPI00217E3A19|nr:beta family protein [Desulfofundulus thermocisternus]MCS5697253.1 beta family protein [Desulfofundulus thermocisternus]
MFDKKHYVPILKWKRGERVALQYLDNSIKNKLTPLIEIVPVSWNYDEDRPEKTLNEHLQEIGTQLSTSWGLEKPLFIDLLLLDPSERMSDGKHPLSFIREKAKAENIKIVPVTGYDRDPSYQTEVKKANAEDALGICIRLTDDDFTYDLESRLNELLEYFKIAPSQVDIVIDFKYISPQDVKKTLFTAIGLLNSIPQINEWRSLTLCGTSFPEHLGDVSSHSLEEIPRVEWLIWNILVTKAKDKINRLPTFGDYTINNPFLIEMDPRLMRMTANIRYTIDDNWLIAKGGQIRKYKWTQAFALCDEIVKDPRFCGPNFSWGDEYIYNCANRVTGYGPGNAEIWRRVGTNHHLTFIVDRLSTFFGP